MMMKNVLSLWVAILSFCATGYNALQPRGEAVRLEWRDLTVVTPDEPTPQIAWAAGQLVRVLSLAAGRELPQCRDSDFDGGTHCIRLRDTGIPEDGGYAIEASGGDLILSGHPANAVLALLEEDLGWRWYSPYVAESVPEGVEALNVVPRSHAPRLLMRDPYYWESRLDPEWSGMNRIVPINALLPDHFGPTHCYVPHQFCHTLPRILSYHHSRENLFAAHPEIFALIDGERRLPPCNPCLTSEAALELVADDILSAARAYPGCRLISVSQGDGAGMFCQCDRCREVIAADGYAGLMLQFVNRVAERVGAEFPAVKISTLAYNETRTPPVFTRPAPNVVIQLTDENLLDAWSAVAPEIYLWYNWPVCFKNLPLPAPGLPEAAARIRRLETVPQVRGVMFLGSYVSPGGSLAPLYAWVLAKLMWDGSRDADALIADFCRGYYGAAAEPMLAYCNGVFHSALPAGHQCGTWDGISGCPNRIRFTPAWLRQARALIAEAERIAADAGDPAVLREIEREELSLLYAGLDSGELNAADLDRLEELVRRFAVTHFNELEHEMTVRQQLDRWRDAISR